MLKWCLLDFFAGERKNKLNWGSCPGIPVAISAFKERSVILNGQYLEF